MITCFLTLIVFWIDTISLTIATTVLNILLQGLHSWEFIKNLPPGSGGVPKIGKIDVFTSVIKIFVAKIFTGCLTN